jgi:hypothetical protein
VSKSHRPVAPDFLRVRPAKCQKPRQALEQFTVNRRSV